MKILQILILSLICFDTGCLMPDTIWHNVKKSELKDGKYEVAKYDNLIADGFQIITPIGFSLELYKDGTYKIRIEK